MREVRAKELLGTKIEGAVAKETFQLRIRPVKAKKIERRWLFSAEEAYRIGLVNRVFDSIESLMEGTMELANTLAIRPGVALKLAKQSLNNSWEIPLSKNLEFEVDAFCETFDTEDKEEGVDAFLNKREAKFQHK